MSLADWAGLAATSFAAALLQAANGFGFAVLATPFFLLFAEPGHAVQLVIIITLALSVVVLPGLHRAVHKPLLLRLALGSLVGLPPGLLAFDAADPVLVRAAAGIVILVFTAVLAANHLRRRGAVFALHPGGDLVTGAVSGFATALVGMAGPPVLIYLMLAGATPRAVRATLLNFFRAFLCGNAGRPCRDNRRAARNLDRRRVPHPLRLGGRADRPDGRRPARQRSRRRARHPGACRRRPLYPRRGSPGRDITGALAQGE